MYRKEGGRERDRHRDRGDRQTDDRQTETRRGRGGSLYLYLPVHSTVPINSPFFHNPMGMEIQILV